MFSGQKSKKINLTNYQPLKIAEYRHIYYLARSQPAAKGLSSLKAAENKQLFSNFNTTIDMINIERQSIINSMPSAFNLSKPIDLVDIALQIDPNNVAAAFMSAVRDIKTIYGRADVVVNTSAKPGMKSLKGDNDYRQYMRTLNAAVHRLRTTVKVLMATTYPDSAYFQQFNAALNNLLRKTGKVTSYSAMRPITKFLGQEYGVIAEKMLKDMIDISINNNRNKLQQKIADQLPNAFKGLSAANISHTGADPAFYGTIRGGRVTDPEKIGQQSSGSRYSDLVLDIDFAGASPEADELKSYFRVNVHTNQASTGISVKSSNLTNTDSINMATLAIQNFEKYYLDGLRQTIINNQGENKIFATGHYTPANLAFNFLKALYSYPKSAANQNPIANHLVKQALRPILLGEMVDDAYEQKNIDRVSFMVINGFLTTTSAFLKDTKIEVRFPDNKHSSGGIESYRGGFIAGSAAPDKIDTMLNSKIAVYTKLDEMARQKYLNAGLSSSLGWSPLAFK